jgi:hypothetical protein
MARRTFGGGTADFVAGVAAGTSILEVAPGSVLTMWSALTGGSQVTDLLNSAGSATATITTDAYGNIPPFSGPNDGTAVLWADAGAGRVTLHATDTEARVAAVESTAAAGPATYQALNPTVGSIVTDSQGRWTSWVENGVSCSVTYDATGNVLTETVGTVTRTFSYSSTGDLSGVA